MEVDMDLSKKTTILLSLDLHEQLTQLAAQKGVSMGQLMREACEKTYRLTTRQHRLEAVRRLSTLCLPVGDVSRMKQESAPSPDELLP
jgi:hypothetical protein